MLKNLADDRGIFNCGNDFGFAATCDTDLDVEIEDALE